LTKPARYVVTYRDSSCNCDQAVNVLV